VRGGELVSQLLSVVAEVVRQNDREPNTGRQRDAHPVSKIPIPGKIIAPKKRAVGTSAYRASMREPFPSAVAVTRSGQAIDRYPFERRRGGRVVVVSTVRTSRASGTQPIPLRSMVTVVVTTTFGSTNGSLPKGHPSFFISVSTRALWRDHQSVFEIRLVG